MKKTNLKTLLILGIMVVFVLVFDFCRDYKEEMDNLTHLSVNQSINQPMNQIVHIPMDLLGESKGENEIVTPVPIASPKEEKTHDKATEKPKKTKVPKLKPASMSDALFIGDSRTVGIMEYAGLKGADYFCNTGMSVFDIRKERVSVPKVGKVTLEELLSNKKYGKVYVMLGINELGYPFESIVNKYRELIEYIGEKQPDTLIFIQANLHISKEQDKKGHYINNKSINELNAKLSGFADNKRIFYVDANFLFDDKEGNLSGDKTSDNVHLYGKYYIEWGAWLRKETTKRMEGE